MLLFARELALRPVRFEPVGPRWMARQIAARTQLCDPPSRPVSEPGAGGAL